MAKPWDRRKGESEPAHAAFLVYRDLGLNRSIEGAVQEYTESTPNSARAFKGWSSRFGWVERCRAWDNHVRAERDRVFMAESRKWERRRLAALESAWLDAQSLRERARKMLAFPLSTQEVKSENGKTITTIKPARWNMGHAALLVKLAAEIEAALGAATAKDPADMTDAELLGVESAYGGDDE